MRHHRSVVVEATAPDSIATPTASDAQVVFAPLVDPSLSTREAILQAAELRLAEVGWLSLSFRDLGERLGIRAPSIHYHFAAKTDLGIALITRLRTVRMLREQALIDEYPNARDRLMALGSLLQEHDADASSNYMISPFHGEYAVLPQAMQQLVTEWIDESLASIAAWLDEGRTAGDLGFAGSAQVQALVLWSVLEQGYRLHRTHPAIDALAAVRQVVDSLAPQALLQERFA